LKSINLATLLKRCAERSWPALLVPFVCSLIACGCKPSVTDNDDKKPPTTVSTTNPTEADEGQKVKLTAEAIEKYGVKVGKVKKHVLLPTFTAPARVAFNTEAVARVGSAVTGRAVELKVKLGDTVAKGDEVLVIESTELGEAQSDLLQRRTALDAATTAVEPVKASYERARKLIESEGVSLGELQKRDAEYKAAQSALQAARGARDAAERKLALLGMTTQSIAAMVKSGQVNPHYAVYAPIAGQVIERNLTLGQLVSPTNDALIVLADLTTLWITADVPEAKLGDLAIGSKARVKIAAVNGRVILGTVAFIAASLDPTTRSVQVRIDVKANDAEGGAMLKPGMFAQAEFETANGKEQAQEVIAVPEEAVQMIDGHPCVFVEDDDEENTFIKRPVAIGREVNGLIPILSGLKEREEIVKAGGFILKAELAKSTVKEND
jgi:cobalt-zinc-cadmium efflux system membrane fusion protein